MRMCIRNKDQKTNWDHSQNNNFEVHVNILGCTYTVKSWQTIKKNEKQEKKQWGYEMNADEVLNYTGNNTTQTEPIWNMRQMKEQQQNSCHLHWQFTQHKKQQLENDMIHHIHHFYILHFKCSQIWCKIYCIKFSTLILYCVYFYVLCIYTGCLKRNLNKINFWKKNISNRKYL